MMERTYQNTNDIVKVVRCKDCRRSYDADGDLMCSFWNCNNMNASVCKDDYCSYGVASK